MVCSVGSPACPCCIVILTPVFSEACNSGTPSRSNQVDEKLTAPPPRRRSGNRWNQASLAVIPSQAPEFKKLEKGRATPLVSVLLHPEANLILDRKPLHRRPRKLRFEKERV